jgi:HK97 family phage prohead protease
MDTKSFRFEVKELTESGAFDGIASVYGVEDLGNDVIERGAFTKTIGENPEVPVLWQHDRTEVIGSGRIVEDGSIVRITGQLDMTDPTAQKAYSKLKLRLVKGLSIGFEAVKSTFEELKGKYIRHINEIKLWEVSIVTFPMLLDAQVTSIKSADADELLERAELELKSGRRLSADTRSQLDTIMGDHQALMTSHKVVMKKLEALLAADVTVAKAADAGEEAAIVNTEPVPDHSGFLSGIDAMLAAIPR